MNTYQWTYRYRLCLRFASFFNLAHRYDIVHNAWLYYLDKEKEDLFEKDLKKESSYLYTVIKNSFFRWNYHERKGSKYRYTGTDGIVSTTDSPDDSLIGKDLYEIFYKKLLTNLNARVLNAKQIKEIKSKYVKNSRMLANLDPRKYGTSKLAKEYGVGESTIREVLSNEKYGEIDNKILEIFKLKADGHTQKEISDDLNISKQLVNQYVKKIEEMAVYNNPFNGSKIVCKKRVSETLWDKRKDHGDFEFEDENEMIKLFVHKESKEGWLVVVKNPKGSEYYIKKLVDNK